MARRGRRLTAPSNVPGGRMARRVEAWPGPLSETMNARFFVSVGRSARYLQQPCDLNGEVARRPCGQGRRPLGMMSLRPHWSSEFSWTWSPVASTI